MTTSILLPKAATRVLNNSQADTLARALEENPDRLAEVHAAIQRLSPFDLEWYLIINFIIPYNSARLHTATEERLKKNEHTVVSVFTDEHGPSFAYTVGLLTETGQELFCSGLNLDTMGIILNQAAAQLRKTPELTELSTSLMVRLRTGEAGRIGIKRVSLQDAVESYCLDVAKHFTVEPHHKLLVLLFPDKENLLPGESGYDAAFDQLLF